VVNHERLSHEERLTIVLDSRWLSGAGCMYTLRGRTAT
jgi:hypothetical protein